jgi:6-pyruvoyltetrahydropterin/6-carboxytetrahydropterin synthase
MGQRTGTIRRNEKVIVRLSQEFHFEASHRLSHLGPDHPCHPLHGHSYRVDIVISGEVNPTTGFLMDYAELQGIVQPVIKQLDHTHLNDVPGLPLSTTEHIADWLWKRLKPTLPMLVEITIRETPATACTYRGE